MSELLRDEMKDSDLFHWGANLAMLRPKMKSTVFVVVVVVVVVVAACCRCYGSFSSSLSQKFHKIYIFLIFSWAISYNLLV